MFLLSVQTIAAGVLGESLFSQNCLPYKYIGAINSGKRFGIKRTLILYSRFDVHTTGVRGGGRRKRTRGICDRVTWIIFDLVVRFIANWIQVLMMRDLNFIYSYNVLVRTRIYNFVVLNIATCSFGFPINVGNKKYNILSVQQCSYPMRLLSLVWYVIHYY